MPKISIQEASDLLGVHPDTLRRWEDEGKITSERTTGGHRRYDVAKLLGTTEREGKTISIPNKAIPLLVEVRFTGFNG
jgi:excisionase family DNA binding protein